MSAKMYIQHRNIIFLSEREACSNFNILLLYCILFSNHRTRFSVMFNNLKGICTIEQKMPACNPYNHFEPYYYIYFYKLLCKWKTTDSFCRCEPKNRTMHLCPRQLLCCLFGIFPTHNSVSKLSVYRWVIMSNLNLIFSQEPYY